MPSKNQKPTPPDWDWEVPAIIAKADITPTHALIGRANASPMTIANESRAPGTVLFKGFAGRRKDDGMYHGVHRFSAAEPNSENDTFAPLPGSGSVDALLPEPNAPPTEDRSVATELEE